MRAERRSAGGAARQPSVLVVAMPAIGHVLPLTHVARELVAHGCRVRFLAGAEFAAVIDGTGAEHVPLPAEADAPAAAARHRSTRGKGGSPLRRLRDEMAAIFVSAIPMQAAAIRLAVADERTDVIVADPLFLGAFLRQKSNDGTEPLVFAYGLMPLLHSGPGVPPFGLGLRPGLGPVGRARDRFLTWMLQACIFAPVQEAAVNAAGGTAPEGFFLDWSRAADRYFQTGPPDLEFPRPGFQRRYEFVGSVPPPSSRASPPTWWPQPARTRPVVFVTQGTVQNDRVDALIEPTIAALTGTGVHILATSGSSTVGPVCGDDSPDVTVVPYVPYEHILPHIDVVVTNGGFGGVQQALAHGVPVIVAGSGQDKSEVAARVAASGAGLSLRTGRPRPRAIRRAVKRTLSVPSYRQAAEYLAEQSRQLGLAVLIDAVLAVPESDALT